jgi:large subunit ribosomal protein L18
MIRRRRREGLTNYSKRVALLKGGLPRVVVRKSNRGITMQVSSYTETGDRVLAQANSNELRQFGWLPKRNTPTAYLTGALLARKSVKLNLEECVLDTGLTKPTKASLLFAAAKGAIDNGLKIRSNIEFDEKRIRGEHIKAYAEKLGGEAGPAFSTYRKGNVSIAQMGELFDRTIGAIKQK